MATSLEARREERATVPEVRAAAQPDDIQAPKGTVLITFLFLLMVAAMWGFMYLTLLRSA
ncbi:MAG TPA: hypothetical protein VIK92_01445 [Thermaerobacter sp.]